nr:MAG TPA: hypothetical protein [Caudoviricetes sp.]
MTKYWICWSSCSRSLWQYILYFPTISQIHISVHPNI